MNNKIKELIIRLLKEFGHEYQELEGFISYKEQPIDITIGTKDHVDYLIFAYIDYEHLNVLCEDVQIDIFTKLKLKVQKRDEADFLAINKSIDKNSTLIVCTQVPEEFCQAELNKVISSIEEESYYYKKQVFSYSVLDERNICDLLANENSVLEECEKIVTDITRYNAFISGEGERKYELISLLYEKLPFLTLNIKSEDRLVLKDEIINSLNEEQEQALTFYNNLMKDGSVEQWINGLGVQND